MPVDLAIVVPVYEEEANVLPLAREIVTALRPGPLAFEVVFVDDGSADGTAAAILEASRAEDCVRGVRHARNAGQSAALWTGLCVTHAPIVATLDGDRQNDPADLPQLLAALERADFVCGVRARRRDPWVRRVSSAVARQARRTFLGVDFRDTGCSLRVFRRSALQQVFPFHGWHRFLPVLVHAAGVTVCELPVSHRHRSAGRSKYGVWNRLGHGLFDLIGVAWYQRRILRAIPWTELHGSP
jgi:dolichol-phosphate mannosyltransferase